MNSNRVLSAEQKAQQFRKLQVITSTSGLEAKLYVEKFRNNPEEWKKVYESIADILSDCNNQRSIPDIKISDSNKSSPKE